MENQQLDDYFGYTEAGSSLEGEMRAGVTTFLTMAYILVVNPGMLSIAGIPFNDALFATAMAAFVGCTIMGLWANQPYALAPGMGLNAYFVFSVVLTQGVAWELALAAVLVEGVLFMIISLPQVGWRSQMINAIPKDLKIATMAGIGMFLAIIGLREMGWIQDDFATLVNIGQHETWTHTSGELWAMVGLLAIAIMMARGMKGAIIYGVMGVTAIAWIMNAMGMAVTDPYNGNAEVVAPALDAIFSTDGVSTGAVGSALGAFSDIGDNLSAFLLVMITFLFVDIFDTAGTLYGVGKMAGKVDADDNIENADEAFMADAGATIVGALCGTSTTTTYIESAAGIEEGGKTGLTAVVVGVLMLMGMFLSGLLQAIPAFAVAPALVVVGAMMMRGAADIDWADKEMAIPAFITMVMMPFTYSIADGIAWGIIAYVAIKVGMGKMDQINKVMGTLCVLMVMFYLGPGGETTFEWLVNMIL
ncbi:MAG TPA: NCS2 family permease [Candidatus Thalassarchaeaceae archaeon]|jgi:AGZA family xanthine/uracil permease-like MFS transporter|nr:NCS2 family permease [Candidatus Thalassarchaeaceae archaeon]HJM67990.1 NCS2 family permease [Candidatus Thalassarchaeaceae archaeon]